MFYPRLQLYVNSCIMLDVKLDGISFAGMNAEEVKEAMSGYKLTSEIVVEGSSFSSLSFKKGNYYFYFDLEEQSNNGEKIVSTISVERKIDKSYDTK